MHEVINCQVTEKDLVEWCKHLNDPSWLQKRRLDFWKSMDELELPLFKYSLGVNALLSSIDLKLPSHVSITTFSNSDAKITTGIESFQKKELFSVFNPKENKLTALHAALVTSVTVIEIPKDVKINEPIVIDTQAANSWASDHLLIIAHPNSGAIIIDNSQGNGRGWRTQGVEIIVESGANVTFASLQTLPQSMNQISFHHAQVHKDGNLNWIEGNFGATELLSKTVTDLVGNGSAVNMQSLFFGCHDQRYDLEGVIHHRSPYSTSNLIAKGVLKDSAKSIYRGLIKIHKNANGCKGIQQEDMLLLSNNAEADAIPILEIDNNDVSCNHSATVGKIDPELLFYMNSRGIPQDEARRLLVLAFFTPILDKLHHKKIEDNMLQLVESRLQ